MFTELSTTLSSPLESTQPHIVRTANSPVTIALVGPWGSGKTTALNSILLNSGLAADRIGVIFAEFGEVNVDAGRIADSRTVEVPNRCICCHGAEALQEGIKALAPSVDLLLIETSGVSVSSNVRDVLGKMNLSFAVVGLCNTAGFDGSDIDLYDAQLPAADVILLTHTDWLGADPDLNNNQLIAVREYLGGINCLDRAVFTRGLGVDVEILKAIVSAAGAEQSLSSLSPVTVNPSSVFITPKGAVQASAAQHHQQVISLVLHDSVDAVQVEAALARMSHIVDRAKGVVVDSAGIRRDFDYVKGRDESGSSRMNFLISDRPSVSQVLGGTSHIAIFSRDNKELLTHAQFLSIGLPNISAEKIALANSRYPVHSDYYAQRGDFPAYSHAGDRFYGVLFPINQRIDEIPEGMRANVRMFWKQALDNALIWRMNGVSVLDGLLADRPGDQILIGTHNLLSLNLLWHCTNLIQDVSPQTQQQLAALRLANRFFSSMRELEQPPELGGRHEFSADYDAMLRQFVQYARNVEGLSTEMIAGAIRRAMATDQSGTWSGAAELIKFIEG